jgi:hypothetical protein
VYVLVLVFGFVLAAICLSHKVKDAENFRIGAKRIDRGVDVIELRLSTGAPANEFIKRGLSGGRDLGATFFCVIHVSNRAEGFNHSLFGFRPPHW